MTSGTAADWLPALKKEIERASHGNGPTADNDEPLRRALEKGIALAPKDWELRCLRGTLLAGRSDFELALADLDRAVALAPKEAKPYGDRAYLHGRRGDWTAALADLDRAAALPGGAGVLSERGLVLLSLGRAAEARADLTKAAAGRSDPEAQYHLARALLVEGKPREALVPLRAALEQGGGDPSRRRMYEMMAAAAAALSHAGKTAVKAAPGRQSMKSGKGTLWLFGVGIERPYEITLNTMMAIKRCDAVYTQVDTREVRELLEALYPGVRSIAVSGGRGADPQEETWKAVRAELERGSQTGYVTYGHPMLFGEGNMMARRCAQAGFPYRVMTAPSSIDAVLTMLQDDLEMCERGFTVANARSLVTSDAAFDAGKGAIVLGINRLFEENIFGKFCDLLDAAFPESHPVLALKCADGYREEKRLAMTVGEFRRKERELDPALTLFIPQAAAAKPAPKPAAKRRKP